MKAVLERAGYFFDIERKVWLRPGYGGINYSDGDEVEERLKHVLTHATDLGVLSDELSQYCIDWPSLYHLTGSRANILRPLQDILKGDILEIGAGCGAITRYLGELGANVLALEGSPRRAEIARLRSRDLNNVEVVTETFEAFNCGRLFDAVTLIGVLEYANLFVSGENPAQIMLDKIKKFLKPNGYLIIAIENQLGLKYFAGAPEDHLGIPMYGIEGRYTNSQPKTFGKEVLSEMIKSSGYSSSQFYASFPDYKLPVTIIPENAEDVAEFNAGILASQCTRKDNLLPYELCFSPELVWDSAFDNKLGIDLANSFLVVATNDIAFKKEKQILAWHFSTNRKEKYCKQTTFLRREGSNIDVLSTSLFNPDTLCIQGELISNEIKSQGNYVPGVIFSQKFVKLLMTKNWAFNDLINLLSLYLSLLYRDIHSIPLNNKECLDANPFASPHQLVPGKYFDFIPQNIVFDHETSAHVFDQEWALEVDCEVGYLLFRALLSIFGGIHYVAVSENFPSNTFWELLLAVFDGLGWSISDDVLLSYIGLEEQVQEEVSGAIFKKGIEQFLKVKQVQPTPLYVGLNVVNTLEQEQESLRQKCTYLFEENERVRIQVESEKRVFDEVKHLNANLQKQLDAEKKALDDANYLNTNLRMQLDAEKRALDEVNRLNANLLARTESLSNTLGSVYESNSWKVTMPLRRISGFLKKVVHISGFRTGSFKETIRRLYRAVTYVVKLDFKGLMARYQALKYEGSDFFHTVTGAKTCVVLTIPHTLFLANLFANRLREHGLNVDVKLSYDSSDESDLFIVLGAQSFKTLPPNHKRVVVQLEQTVSSRWFTKKYISVLKRSLAVFDYSLKNIAYLSDIGVSYPNVYYLPIGASTKLGFNDQDSEYDILFYGDYKSSPRRQKFLKALQERYSVKLIDNVFGDAVWEHIRSAKLVINLHYYENAILEMPRIQEVLSLGVPVVSEDTEDSGEYPELVGAVHFFKQNDICDMLDKVKVVLSDLTLSKNFLEESVNATEKRFNFMLDRALIGLKVLSLSKISDGEIYLLPSFNSVVLSLPETIQRRNAIKNLHLENTVIFDGVRYSPGWVGCGLSYKKLAQHALHNQLKELIVFEDDALLPECYEEKLAVVKEYLTMIGDDGWDIFSGLIAVLHQDVKVLKVENYRGLCFVTIDKVISLVYSIFNQRVLEVLAEWDPSQGDATTNTIDKSLENRSDLKVVVTYPFFVGHKEDIDSTLWGINNSKYKSLIDESQNLLKKKIDAFVRSSN